MKVPRDEFLIAINMQAKYMITHGTLELHMDPEYDLMKNEVQYGIVHTVPEACPLYKGYDLPEVGDKVYFHHFVQDNKLPWISEDIFFAGFDSIYCKVNQEGKVTMLNDFAFISKAYDEETVTASGIILDGTADGVGNVNEQSGFAKFLPEGNEKYGVNIGDKILFTQNSDYELEVEGEEGYIMRMNADVVIKVEDGKEKVLGDWCMVRPLDEGDNYEKTDSGIFLLSKTVADKCKGEILQLPVGSHPDGLKEGDQVIFDKKAFQSVKLDGETVYLVKIANDPFWAKYEMN